MWAGAPWGCAVVGCPPLNVERQRNRGFSQFVQEFVRAIVRLHLAHLSSCHLAISFSRSPLPLRNLLRLRTQTASALLTG